MNTTFKNVLIAGLVGLGAYYLFFRKPKGMVTVNPEADDAEDTESFYGAIGRKQREAVAKARRKSNPIGGDIELDEEVDSVENIGIRKAKAKPNRGSSLKARILDAVVSELGVSRIEAYKLLKKRDESVLPILERFRGDIKKVGRSKKGSGIAVGMQNNEQSDFAFNGMEETD